MVASSRERHVRRICKGCGHAEHIGSKCNHQIPTGVLDQAPVWLRLEYTRLSFIDGSLSAQQWHPCYCASMDVFTRVATDG